MSQTNQKTAKRFAATNHPPAHRATTSPTSGGVSPKRKTQTGGNAKGGDSVEIQFAEAMADRMDCVPVSALESEGSSAVYTWKNDAEGARWQINSPKELIIRAMVWLKENASDQGKPTKAQSCAEWYTGELASRTRFLPQPDKQRSLVALRNAVLEIHRDGTVQIHDPDPQLGVTACVQVDLPAGCDRASGYRIPELNPDSLFGRYIHSTLPDPEVRALAQEALSTVLISRCFEKAIWLYGKGENGKSVMLKLLASLLPSATQALDLERLTKDQFGKASLIGKRLVTVAELPPYISPECQGALKALISRDPTMVERKRRDAEMFVPEAVFVMASNHHPSVREHEHGFWRKIITLPFTQRVDKTKKVDNLDWLITSNPTELMEFVNWLLAGAVRLQIRNRFLYDDELPAAVRRLRAEQMLDSDNVANFISEHALERDAANWNSRAELYELYCSFCKQGNYKALAERPFLTRLRERLGLTDEDFTRCRVNGVREQMVRVSGDFWEPKVSLSVDPAGLVISERELRRSLENWPDA